MFLIFSYISCIGGNTYKGVHIIVYVGGMNIRREGERNMTRDELSRPCQKCKDLVHGSFAWYCYAANKPGEQKGPRLIRVPDVRGIFKESGPYWCPKAEGKE
jgi:hypothetical protein